MLEGEKIHAEVQLPDMKPVLKSQQKHFSFVVSALRENRLHVTARSDDIRGHVNPQTGDVIGQVVLVRADGQVPICALNFPLPASAAEPEDVGMALREAGEKKIERVLKKKKKSWDEERMNWKDERDSDEDEGRSELRLTDVAEMVHGDWQKLATQLGVSDTDINNNLTHYSYPSEQVCAPYHALQRLSNE